MIVYTNNETGRQVKYDGSTNIASIDLADFAKIKSYATRELIMFFSHVKLDGEKPSQPVTSKYNDDSKQYTLDSGDDYETICTNINYTYLAWYLNISLASLKASIKELTDAGHIYPFGHKANRFIAIGCMLSDHIAGDWERYYGTDNPGVALPPIEREKDVTPPTMEMLRDTYVFFKDDFDNYCMDWFLKLYGDRLNRMYL